MAQSATRLMAALLVVGMVSANSQARLPRTLNFQNVTGTNVNSTVSETASNEKEVESGDFDNDGDLDVVIAAAYSDFGERRNKLYRNDGGVFHEISGAPVIPGFSQIDVSRNAFFRDYDRDGWLDIIIVNDANSPGEEGRTKLYINKQVDGEFNRFDEEGLVRLGANTGGAACGAVSFDPDQDGDFDLYVGNYPGPSQDTMYFNDGDGYFTNVTGSHVPSDGDYTVDVATGDMNGDGQIDLLISNHGANYLYYNDLNGAGLEVGDFSYSGSVQNLGNAAVSENAMEPGDFDNDGRLDFYWANRYFSSSGADRIYHNIGNDANNKAAFQDLTAGILPASVTGTTSRKATVVDLNHDGRLDIIVMKEDSVNSRPTILRNTTVNGTISFVDWTPATAFPSGHTHKGWHAAAFDADGDGWEDIFLGGWLGDHLFQNIASNERTEEEVGGTVDNLLNQDPIAIVGHVADGEDSYTITEAAAGQMMAIVLYHPCSDLKLGVINGADVSVIDRGGLGVEEAVQVDNVSAGFRVTVSLNQACGDANADGHVDLSDYQSWLDCVTGPGGSLPPGCEAFDSDGDGDGDFADFQALQQAYSGPGEPATSGYVLELLLRN